MNKCKPNSKGVVIPGSADFSDLISPISVIKKKLKSFLLDVQKNGRSKKWILLVFMVDQILMNGTLKISFCVNSKLIVWASPHITHVTLQ